MSDVFKSFAESLELLRRGYWLMGHAVMLAQAEYLEGMDRKLVHQPFAGRSCDQAGRQQSFRRAQGHTRTVSIGG